MVEKTTDTDLMAMTEEQLEAFIAKPNDVTPTVDETVETEESQAKEYPEVKEETETPKKTVEAKHN